MNDLKLDLACGAFMVILSPIAFVLLLVCGLVIVIRSLMKMLRLKVVFLSLALLLSSCATIEKCETGFKEAKLTYTCYF